LPRAAGAIFVAALVVALSPAAASAGSRHHDDGGNTTVATGLDNPRGLVFLHDGKLAVAEAGHAGDICLGEGECLGLNGQVTAISTRSGHHKALATGLPSLGGPFGAF